MRLLLHQSSSPPTYCLDRNSPVDVVSSQLRFMPGAFVYYQTLFHLFEVGLNIFLYFRESLNSSERANDLLQKKKKHTAYSGMKAQRLMHNRKMVYSPYINNGELVSDVFMTSEVPDIFFQLLTQHQELVQFGNVEEVFCTRSIAKRQLYFNHDRGRSGLIREPPPLPLLTLVTVSITRNPYEYKS